MPAETLPVEKVYSRKQPEEVRTKPDGRTPERTEKAATLFEFAKFILVSGLTGLFGNFGIILLGSSVGGVLVGLAYYLGEKTRYKMLAGMTGCAGLRGVVGIAVGLFRAAGPPHPDAPPVASNTLLSEYYELGQLAERERIKGLTGKRLSDQALSTGQSVDSTTDKIGVKSLPDSLFIKPLGEKKDRYVPLSERLEKERKD